MTQLAHIDLSEDAKILIVAKAALEYVERELQALNRPSNEPARAVAAARLAVLKALIEEGVRESEAPQQASAAGARPN